VSFCAMMMLPGSARFRSRLSNRKLYFALNAQI
jgi:hypothetical protein